MQKNVLQLESSTDKGSVFRTIFKTSHGRVVFLSVQLHDSYCTIQDCFYLDRNQGRTGPARYSARPKMLRTIQFPAEQLLSVIEAELDKKFYGVTYTQDKNTGLPLDAYIRKKAEQENRKYRFLILVGEGERLQGLPIRLRTRLKNRLHRAIYFRPGLLQKRPRCGQAVQLLRPAVPASGGSRHAAHAGQLLLPLHQGGHPCPGKPGNML